MTFKVGDVVKGNRYAGLVKKHVGVIVSTTMKSPRTVKVIFKNFGEWLITPDEIYVVNNNEVDEEFYNNTMSNINKIRTPRSDLIALLSEALNHIDDEELNSRIIDVIKNNT